MPIDILMPALSPTMDKGNLIRWLKKEDDSVKSGDVLAEIETDKATMEVEAIDEGVLAKIVVPEGTDHVAVNTLIAVIAGEGEDAAEIAKSDAQPASPKSPPAQPKSEPAQPKSEPAQPKSEPTQDVPVAAVAATKPQAKA